MTTNDENITPATKKRARKQTAFVLLEITNGGLDFKQIPLPKTLIGKNTRDVASIKRAVSQAVAAGDTTYLGKTLTVGRLSEGFTFQTETITRVVEK